MNNLSLVLEKRGEKQYGINMVDLMMWLVIAALLLAAAIQGIGYYQKAAYLYQMQSDLDGVGTLATGKAAQNKGVIDKAVAEEGVADGKFSAQVAPFVEGTNDKPYLRATHPGVEDKDVLYLFDNCGENYKIGVNVVPKGGSPELADCGISSTPPAGGGGGSVTPTPGDIDGDGIPNGTDPDVDGDDIPNGTDPDDDNDGTPDTEDSAPNDATIPGGGGGTTPPDGAEYVAAGWGDNRFGALGLGTQVDATAPTAISGFAFSQVSAGNSHSCGISDEKAYCWGAAHMGRLGIGDAGKGANGYGDNVYMLTPTAVDTTGVLNGKKVTSISAGQAYTCAIADGAAYCWGNDTNWQTTGASAATNMNFSPMAVNTAGTVMEGKVLKSIEASWYQTCALDTAGNAYCWGRDVALGHGIPGGKGTSSKPIAVAGGKTFTSLTGAMQHYCGLGTDQVAYCWGSNADQQLGTSVGARAESPTPIAGMPSPVTSIAAGEAHNCAVANQKVYCLGANWSQQLGDGTGNDALTPIEISTGDLSGINVLSVWSGDYITCAVSSNGVFCWGEGYAGDGTDFWDEPYTPVRVTGDLTGKEIKSISVGEGLSFVLYI